MSPTPLVRGTIVFPSERPDLTEATVYVRLEDVALANSSAEVIAEQVIRDVPASATDGGIPFVLPGDRDEIDPRGRYTVAVHVDIDDSGDVTAGDYITTKHDPVLASNGNDYVTVSVQRVG